MQDLSPLAQFATHQPLQIGAMECTTEMQRRLMGLGIRIGTHLSLVEKRPGGIVVGYQGNRIALGDAISAQLMARPVST